MANFKSFAFYTNITKCSVILFSVGPTDPGSPDNASVEPLCQKH